jgi:hypothetical protein
VKSLGVTVSMISHRATSIPQYTPKFFLPSYLPQLQPVGELAFVFYTNSTSFFLFMECTVLIGLPNSTNEFVTTSIAGIQVFTDWNTLQKTILN